MASELSLLANLATIFTGIIALLTILGGLFEAITGYFRRKLKKLDRIPAVEHKVDAVADRQEDLIYGLLDVAEAANDEDKEVDTEELVRDFLEGRRQRGDYVRGGDQAEATDRV